LAALAAGGVDMSLLPGGEYDPMAMIFGNRGPSWLPQGQRSNPFPSGGPLGNQQQSGIMGILGRPETQDLALSLLANSGYSPNKRSFGEILGTSALQAKQMGAQRADAGLDREYKMAQIGALQNRRQQSQFGTVPVDKFTPESLQKFARTGVYTDLVPVEEKKSDPSEVASYKYWSSLTPQQQQDFLKLKRNVGSDYAIETVNGVPTVVYKPAAGGPGVAGGTPLVTPLTNLPQQAAGAETIKQAEGRGGSIGKAEGDITSGILTKGSNAKTVLSMIDEADKIVDKATGSAGGAVIDTAAAAFGKSTEGAQNIARLKVLQAGLMLNMPRMEGPQSDRDVQLYREAAASLGEPNVPRETKKAALETIRVLQERYKQRAAGVDGASPKESAADRAKRLGL
jgi:hypothetical protein